MFTTVVSWGRYFCFLLPPNDYSSNRAFFTGQHAPIRPMWYLPMPIEKNALNDVQKTGQTQPRSNACPSISRMSSLVRILVLLFLNRLIDLSGSHGQFYAPFSQQGELEKSNFLAFSHSPLSPSWFWRGWRLTVPVFCVCVCVCIFASKSHGRQLGFLLYPPPTPLQSRPAFDFQCPLMLSSACHTQPLACSLASLLLTG